MSETQTVENNESVTNDTTISIFDHQIEVGDTLQSNGTKNVYSFTGDIIETEDEILLKFETGDGDIETISPEGIEDSIRVGGKFVDSDGTKIFSKFYCPS